MALLVRAFRSSQFSARCFSMNTSEKNRNMLSALKNCKFSRVSPVKDMVIVGEVQHIVDKDIYVDYGGKFLAVVEDNGSVTSLQVGSLVKIKVVDLEASAYFMGQHRSCTARVTDACLLGNYNPPRVEGWFAYTSLLGFIARNAAAAAEPAKDEVQDKPAPRLIVAEFSSNLNSAIRRRRKEMKLLT